MAGITLAQAKAKLDTWMEADDKLARGQSASMSGRTVTRAETDQKIAFWDKKVRQLSRGGKRLRLAVPRG